MLRKNELEIEDSFFATDEPTFEHVLFDQEKYHKTLIFSTENNGHVLFQNIF